MFCCGGDGAADWSKPERHSSRIIASNDHSALIQHDIDATSYFLLIQWQGDATLQECDRHHFELSTTADVLAFTAQYLHTTESIQAAAAEVRGTGPATQKALVFDQELKAVIKAWNSWWQQGAIADFSQCTDPRARELERRVVLSQYLTQVNCANNTPPKATTSTPPSTTPTSRYTPTRWCSTS